MRRLPADELDRLIAAIPGAPSFKRMGKDLTAGEHLDGAIWLAGLGLMRCKLERTRDWKSAKRISADPRWDRGWWDTEEKLRVGLLRICEKKHGKERALQRLSEAAQAAHDPVMKAAHKKIPDPSVAAAAAGAATQACYQGALAALAGMGESHAFSAKLTLFLHGRWPLGILRGRAYMF